MERRRFLKSALGALAGLVTWPFRAGGIVEQPVDHLDARLRLLGITTGRMSSGQPSFQEICRACGTAHEPGTVLVQRFTHGGLDWDTWVTVPFEDMRPGDLVKMCRQGRLDGPFRVVKGAWQHGPGPDDWSVVADPVKT